MTASGGVPGSNRRTTSEEFSGVVRPTGDGSGGDAAAEAEKKRTARADSASKATAACRKPHGASPARSLRSPALRCFIRSGPSNFRLSVPRILQYVTFSGGCPLFLPPARLLRMPAGKAIKMFRRSLSKHSFVAAALALFALATIGCADEASGTVATEAGGANALLWQIQTWQGEEPLYLLEVTLRGDGYTVGAFELGTGEQLTFATEPSVAGNPLVVEFPLDGLSELTGEFNWAAAAEWDAYYGAGPFDFDTFRDSAPDAQDAEFAQPKNRVSFP